jgi:hypothetical protein
MAVHPTSLKLRQRGCVMSQVPPTRDGWRYWQRPFRWTARQIDRLSRALNGRGQTSMSYLGQTSDPACLTVSVKDDTLGVEELTMAQPLRGPAATFCSVMTNICSAFVKVQHMRAASINLKMHGESPSSWLPSFARIGCQRRNVYARWRHGSVFWTSAAYK